MALPRESHSWEIWSKNKSVYENAAGLELITQLHGLTHLLLVVVNIVCVRYEYLCYGEFTDRSSGESRNILRGGGELKEATYTL